MLNDNFSFGVSENSNENDTYSQTEGMNKQTEFLNLLKDVE